MYISYLKTRIVLFGLGVLFFYNMDFFGSFLGVLGILLVGLSITPAEGGEPPNFNGNRKDKIKNYYNLNEIRDKDTESQIRFKKNNEYWNNKYRKDNPEFEEFEVHYMTYNYPNVIKEIVYGANILEIKRKYQADPKVRRLITVR